MKEKDVLVELKEHQLIIYAEKNDDTYGPVQTGSFATKNYYGEFLKIQQNLEKSLAEKLEKREISPIFFYMTLEELTISELASRVGLPKYKVKKHLDPAFFDRIKVSELKRYARVFNIPVANFFQIIFTKQDIKWRMGYDENKEKSATVFLSQTETNNPLIVTTKAEINQI